MFGFGPLGATPLGASAPLGGSQTSPPTTSFIHDPIKDETYDWILDETFDVIYEDIAQVVANLKIIYNDQTPNATLIGGTWQLPLTNLQDRRPSKVARSTNATTVSTQFALTYSATKLIQGVALVGTNLDVNAQVQVQCYDTTVSPTLTLYDSGLLSVWASSAAIEDPDGKGLNFPILFGQDVQTNFVYVTIHNTANADGYVEIGKVVVGEVLETTFNIEDGSSFTRDANTQVQKAVSGTPYFNRRKNIRQISISYPFEDWDVAWDQIDRMCELSGIDVPVFVTMFPDDSGRLSKQSFLCTLSKMPTLKMLAIGSVATALDLTEYVG